MKIKANLMYRPGSFELSTCQVEKVVELSGLEFDQFLAAPQEVHPFIEENRELMYQWNGVDHCLLVLGKNRTDGVLVEAEGHSFARYAAYVPEARAIVEARLKQAADLVIRRGVEDPETGQWFFHLEELEDRLGLTIRKGNGLAEMLLDMLSRREEIAEAKLMNGSIVVSRCPEFYGQLHGADDALRDIYVKDVLPLLKGGGLVFLCHEEAEVSVLAENLQTLTEVGYEDFGALLDARVSEICPSPEGIDVVITDVVPEELMRFNEAYDGFVEAEQTMGPTMQ